MKRTHALLSRLGACALFALAGWAGAAAPQRDWPQVPVPGDARAFWVAEYIEQNTVPMQIRGLESRAPMKEVSRYYEKWLAERPADWREPWEGWSRTRYEAKAVREGRTPHYLRFRRL